MSVLERHIQVGQNLRVGGHDLDEPVGDVARVGVHHPYPVHLRHGTHQVFQQHGQAVFHPQIVTVIGGILRYQDEFAHAQFAQLDALR